MSEFFLVQTYERSVNDSEDTPVSPNKDEPTEVEKTCMAEAKITRPIYEEIPRWNLEIKSCEEGVSCNTARRVPESIEEDQIIEEPLGSQ